MPSASLDIIRTAQNADGGWPYRKGGSWTEPTVFALLAMLAAKTPPPREHPSLIWLRKTQRQDGGWAPRPAVDQTTWVTALVALLPSELLGKPAHMRAVNWLLKHSGMESTSGFQVREFLVTGELPGNSDSGWPWYPGAAAWVTPTAMSTLALKKCYWRTPAAVLRERIDAAQSFLLSRRCADGGWNHGSARALGYNSDSYPETTGQALMGMHGKDSKVLEPSFLRARQLLTECRSAAGYAWLRLGLASHKQLPLNLAARRLRCHTIADTALEFIADRAEAGYNVLLDS
ncbi:MAG: prenyltransferase/squalene oxidase repeat-containing protein [Bryobacteraceae bacterium]